MKLWCSLVRISTTLYPLLVRQLLSSVIAHLKNVAVTQNFYLHYSSLIMQNLYEHQRLCLSLNPLVVPTMWLLARLTLVYLHRLSFLELMKLLGANMPRTFTVRLGFVRIGMI